MASKSSRRPDRRAKRRAWPSGSKSYYSTACHRIKLSSRFAAPMTKPTSSVRRWPPPASRLPARYGRLFRACPSSELLALLETEFDDWSFDSLCSLLSQSLPPKMAVCCGWPRSAGGNPRAAEMETRRRSPPHFAPDVIGRRGRQHPHRKERCDDRRRPLTRLVECD